jgi:hypothetical protein
MNNKGLRGVFGLVLGMFCAVAIAQDALLDRARALIQQKQYKQAYALLEPQEQARAGDVNYDYLFGIAAIDSGQLTRGVFALERVLAVNPNHAQARAEIARAYFLMGENRTARQEFQNVKASRPPAEVDATVDRFLNALDARERSRHTGVTGYIELGLGHDSNINSATSATSFAIPAFGGAVFTLAPGANEQDDQYRTLGAGVSGRIGITDSIGLVGSASLESKSNFNYEFDTAAVNGSGGLSIRGTGGTEWIIALQGQKYYVDNNTFRDASGGVAQYRTNVTPNDQVSVYAQYTQLRYPGVLEVRDADRTVFGGAWAHAYSGVSGSPVSYAGLYFGKEDPKRDNVPHFGHDVVGARLGGQIGLTEKWTFTASGNFEQRKYGGPDPLFLVERDDKELQLRGALIYQFDKNWSVTPSVTLTKVSSNIIVNEYDRWMAAITGRYDFR